MGNDFRLGIEIGNGHYHGRGDDRYHQPQIQIDPITFEARQIANELDRGETHRAAEHLRRDLQQMPSFRDQRELVEKIDMFDRKGVGADLNLRRPDRQGGIWDDISISPPRYYERGPYGVYGGGGRQGYPPVYRHGRPEVDIHIDLNLFKNHGGRR